MAKKNVESSAVAEDAGTIPATVAYAGLSITITDIPAAGIAYLLQYGFAKSLQDSVAGMKKALSEEKGEDGESKYTGEEIEAALAAAMQERVTRILEGTIGTRTAGVPKATPFEARVTKVAKAMLKAAAANAKKVLPKADSEEYAALLSGFTTKHRERIEEEAKRQMEVATDFEL